MLQALETEQTEREILEAKIDRTLRGILSEFERAGIPALILRNVHYIPSLIVDGGDVDIAIPSVISEKQLISLVGHYGLIQWVSKRKTVYAYFKITDSYILRVDFSHRVNQWLGADFIEESRIYAGSYLENGFWVADRSIQAILKWLPGILIDSSYRERYGADIVEAAKCNPEGFQKLLEYALGENLSSKYWEWARNGTPEQSANCIRKTRNAVWWTAFRRKPVASVAGLISHFWLEILCRLKLRPAGISVALLGTDGSGKSTLSARLVEAPYQNLPFHGMHHRRFSLPGLTPMMRKGRARVFGDDGVVARGPHDKKQHNFLVGLVRLSYTLLRFWIGEFSWVRHRIAKNALIVHDRHLIDVFVDPARLRFKGPRWISQLIGKLAPQPELVILLDAPAEIVNPRKREVPIEETDRQRHAYLDLVQGMENAFVVDASLPVDDLLDEVQQIINTFMMDRSRKRIREMNVHRMKSLEEALA